MPYKKLSYIKQWWIVFKWKLNKLLKKGSR